jgi:microcystin-dependent protein|tara:strand:+ start:1548 stop:2123 length:576 start_codon:yes stop_codon:yes gene_type:complete
MSNYEATKYDFSGANLTGIEGIPTATIVPWSSSSVPTGFLECNGQAVSRSTYSALFAIISTTYGTGDGASTFNVPNLSDNVAIGKSNNKALASTGGANTVASAGNVGGSTANATLSTSQLASHSHPQGRGNPGSLQNNPASNPPQLAGGGPGNTGSAGSGGGHSHNMSANFSGDATSVIQPYLTVIYIIKT